MAQLRFKIEHQIITRTDNFLPVAKSQNYLNASFTFSDDWGDNDKIAIFHVGNNSYEMILDSENECLVPWEVLTTAGNMYVSVYSGDRITATKALVKILPTGYTEEVSATQNPTIDVYSSLLSRMNTIDKNIVSQVNVALTEAKESGEFKGDKGDPGDDYVLTQADKEEIADLVDGAVIDDSAGIGDTDKTWSANKIAADAKAVEDELTNIKTDIGDLDELDTTDKSSLVNAINETRGTGGGGSVTIDSALSDTSTNPVQNKVITTALDDKADLSDLSAVATSGNYTDLINKPTIPTKTSDLTNDSGFITSVPVTSVNDQTGTVVIPQATTATDGLMSSADKTHLDAVYADYSLALTALGVI